MHVAHPSDRRRVASDLLDEVGEEAEDLLVEVAVRRPEGGSGSRLGPRLAVAVVAPLEAGERGTRLPDGKI